MYQILLILKISKKIQVYLLIFEISKDKKHIILIWELSLSTSLCHTVYMLKELEFASKESKCAIQYMPYNKLLGFERFISYATSSIACVQYFLHAIRLATIH